VTARVRPVSRRRVGAGLAIAILIFAGIVGLAEGLRHPAPDDADGMELGPDDDDPRLEVECEDPLPREGLERPIETVAEPTATVLSNDLYDCPATWDARAVRYRGEVVGAVLRRRGGAWVQLNDDIYADLRGPLPAHRDYRGGNAGVGVFIPHSLADDIRVVGGPTAHGDILEVTGRFHRVEPTSREAYVIVADAGRVERAGTVLEDPVLRDRQVAAVLLVVAAAAMAALERVVARRRRWGPSKRAGRR
jgi:hypothetical protein